jgi:hypothetical protein
MPERKVLKTRGSGADLRFERNGVIALRVQRAVLPTGVRFFFAACDLVTALLVLVATFMGLPARWWPIDGSAILVAVALAAAGVAHALGRAPIVIRIGCGIVLAVGLVLIAFLSISASHLSGVYGPIGEGGALLMLLVIALAIPYLIALPAAQLVWARKK